MLAPIEAAVAGSSVSGSLICDMLIVPPGFGVPLLALAPVATGEAAVIDEAAVGLPPLCTALDAVELPMTLVAAMLLLFVDSVGDDEPPPPQATISDEITGRLAAPPSSLTMPPTRNAAPVDVRDG